MNTPGFTAENTLYKTIESYGLSESQANYAGAQMVLPQQLTDAGVMFLMRQPGGRGLESVLGSACRLACGAALAACAAACATLTGPGFVICGTACGSLADECRRGCPSFAGGLAGGIA